MIIDRQRYDKPYIPKNKETIQHFVWFNSFFTEENKTPEAHFQLVDHLLSKNQYKGVMCHRGIGKSTKIVHLILEWLYLGKKPNFGEFDYILIIQDAVSMVASTFEQLISMIADSDLSKVLTITKSKLGDDPTLYVYNNLTKKTMYLKGRGSGQSMRGIRTMGKRPNIVILDDIENEEKHFTKESRTKLKNWFDNVVLPSINTNKYEFVFIGTPIHEDSLLLELVGSKQWKFITLPLCEDFDPSDLNNLIVSWKDRFTPSEIKKIYEDKKDRGKETSFYQEYMLEVTPKDDLLFDLKNINKFKLMDFKDKLPSLTYYISVDLAVSEKQYADYTSITVIGVDTSNNWFLVDGFYGRIKPDITIEKIFYYVSKWQPYEVVLEKVAFQLSMKTFIYNEMVNRGKFFNLKMIGKTKAKLAVIKAFQPVLELGRFWIPEDYMQSFTDELLHEMGLITNDKILSKHDDLIDSVAQLTLIDMISVSPIATGSDLGYNNSEYKNSYAF